MTTDEALMWQAVEALEDINSGWRYIRQNHGDLYGVGWDRAENKATIAIAALRARLAAPNMNAVRPDHPLSDGTCIHGTHLREHCDECANTGERL